jgi:hypothetical protein
MGLSQDRLQDDDDDDDDDILIFVFLDPYKISFTNNWLQTDGRTVVVCA